MDILKSLKGWRTIALNVIAGILPAWDTLMMAASTFIPTAQQYGLFDYIPDKWKGVYVVVLVALNVMLRFKTNTPVGQK
jgi:hypothetical protein